MTDRFVDPGLDKIQAVLNAANATGDRIILRNGSYTFSTTGMELASGIVGKQFTDLVVMAENQGEAILNVNGCPFSFCQCRGVPDVLIDGFVVSGTPGELIFSDLNGRPTGWTFSNLILACGISPWQLTDPGVGMRIEDITTTTGFGGGLVVDITGPDAVEDIGLIIQRVDATLHDGSLTRGIRLRDVHDARIRDVTVYNPTTYGLQFQSTNPSKQCQNIYVSNAFVHGAGSVGIHTGNTVSAVSPTSRVFLHNIYVEDCDGYGVEFENGVVDCELVNFRIMRVQRIGVALAEDTERILVSNGVVDTVGDLAVSSAVVTAVGRRHRIVNCVFANSRWGVTISYPPNFVVPEERILIAECIFLGNQYVYRATTTAMRSGVSGHLLGPNVVVAPSVAYADVNGSPQTQGQFEAAFPDSIVESDTVIATEASLAFFDSANSDYATYLGSTAEDVRAGFFFTHPHIDQQEIVGTTGSSTYNGGVAPPFLIRKQARAHSYKGPTTEAEESLDKLADSMDEIISDDELWEDY